MPKPHEQLHWYMIWLSANPMSMVRGYNSDDQFRCAKVGVLPTELKTADDRVEHVFREYNRDDAPLPRSLSVGDVVTVDGAAFAIDRKGMRVLNHFQPRTLPDHGRSRGRDF